MNKILSINLKLLIVILVILPFTMNSQNVLITDDAAFSTPATLLQVHKAGTSGANLLQLTSGATGTNVSNGFKIQLNADKSIVIDNQENAGLNFYTNKIGRFFIQADGKIAIGGAGAVSTGSGNLLQVIGGNTTPSNLGSSSLIEVDAAASSANVVNLRQAETGTVFPKYSVSKSRGTLDTPVNLSLNDTVGSYTFSGYVGGTWKTLGKITCLYPGNGSTQAGTMIFQTANNGEPSTKMTINPNGVVTLTGDLIYSLSYGSMYLENGSYTPVMTTKNTYYKIAPGAAGGMIVSASSGITVVPDSITILSAGFYKIDIVIDMQGANGNDFRVKMFKNHSPTGVAGSGTITTMGAGNRVCLSYFYFTNLAVNDVLSFWVTNSSMNNNACTINDMKIYIEKKPSIQ